MHVLIRNCESPIRHVLLTVQNTQRALLLIDNRQFSWIFTQTNLSSIYRHKFIVTSWALVKHQALLKIQTKLKLAIMLFFSFSLFGRARLWRNSRTEAWAKGGKP